MPRGGKANFDWQEIAQALRLTTSEDRAGFWLEIQRSHSKALETRKQPGRFSSAKKMRVAHDVAGQK